MLPHISIIFDILFARYNFCMALEILMMIQPIQYFMMDSPLIGKYNHTKRSEKNVDIWHACYLNF